MVSLRPLLTATAAGGLLAALWFVPSANATVEFPENGTARAGQEAPAADDAPAVQDAPAAQAAGADQATGAADRPGAQHAAQTSARTPAEPDAGLALADTGSVDTTPYLIGGTAFLGIGAGFMSYSVRRRGATAA